MLLIIIFIYPLLLQTVYNSIILLSTVMHCLFYLICFFTKADYRNIFFVLKSRFFNIISHKKTSLTLYECDVTSPITFFPLLLLPLKRKLHSPLLPELLHHNRVPPHSLSNPLSYKKTILYHLISALKPVIFLYLQTNIIWYEQSWQQISALLHHRSYWKCYKALSWISSFLWEKICWNKNTSA